MPIYCVKALLSNEMPMKQHPCPQKNPYSTRQNRSNTWLQVKIQYFLKKVNSSEESTVIGNRVKDE